MKRITHPLSYNQRRLIKLMREKNLVIQCLDNHQKTRSESYLQTQDGSDIYERVPRMVLNGLIGRDIFNSSSKVPAVDFTLTTYSLKKDI